ncbi:MAG: hypothetical protein Q8K55_11070 [Gemmatimonadaceae bacterium]|nr:hypothetical protein [Gemmatimonadaceae bacterium]
MLRHGGAALAAMVVSLFAGTAGYHVLGELPWVDALENASMILGGMGPVDPIRSTAGKLFASGYALYSGVFFLLIAGVLLAPVFHRLMHHFHLDRNERSR